MRGIDRDGDQGGKDLAHEIGFKPILIGLGQRGGRQERERFLRQLVPKLGPARLLARAELRHRRVYLLDLLAGRQAIRGWFGDARRGLLVQARDADAVEFVEVRSRNGQEADALQQRVAPVAGFLQDALIEFEP